MHNRIPNVPEDASITLDTIASDILSASGRAMIKAIMAGQEHPDWLIMPEAHCEASERNCDWPCVAASPIMTG